MSNRPTEGAGSRSKKKGDDSPVARRTWRSYAAWAVMALLIAVAFAEIRAETGYKKHLKICQEALERAEVQAAGRPKKVRFDDLKDRFSSQPTYKTAVVSFTKSGVYTWTWQGVRRYTLKLVVDPNDGTIWDIIETGNSAGQN